MYVRHRIMPFLESLPVDGAVPTVAVVPVFGVSPSDHRHFHYFGNRRVLETVKSLALLRLPSPCVCPSPTLSCYIYVCAPSYMPFLESLPVDGAVPTVAVVPVFGVSPSDHRHFHYSGNRRVLETV